MICRSGAVLGRFGLVLGRLGAVLVRRIDFKVTLVQFGGILGSQKLTRAVENGDARNAMNVMRDPVAP